jgi:peptidoglycan/xylan/chitin deacetylase (PgdA/CDA1 family)
VRAHQLRQILERLFFVVEHTVTALLYPYCLVREQYRPRMDVPILMYHQVGRLPRRMSERQDCVTPEQFERQLRAILESGYKVISLGRFIQLVDELPDALKRCVVLTFDDGYHGQFKNAYPILRRYGVPGTFFLVAGSVGSHAILPHLDPERVRIGDDERLAEWRPMLWEEARELAHNGMEIGSHGSSHRSLGRIRGDDVTHEVRRSREILEAQLGVRVEVFAYPFGSRAYGDFGPSIQAVLRDSGYRGACTTVVGRNDRCADRFALRRLPVEDGDGPFRIRAKILGAFDWTGPVKELWQRFLPRKERVDLELVTAITPAGGTR